MLFFSDKEIKISKSEVLKFFENFKTPEMVSNYDLPIAKITECPDGLTNRAYEIDVSSKELLKKKMNVSKMDCIPFLFVCSAPSKTEYTVTFK
jgi:hypothetical protein